MTTDRTQHWQALVFTVTCIQPLARLSVVGYSVTLLDGIWVTIICIQCFCVGVVLERTVFGPWSKRK